MHSMNKFPVFPFESQFQFRSTIDLYSSNHTFQSVSMHVFNSMYIKTHESLQICIRKYSKMP